MLTRRGRTWAITAAAFVVIVVAVLVVLPFVVRVLAVRRVEAMTGRPVSIADVDLNLFTRRILFEDVLIASPDGAPPLAAVPRVEARFRLLPFFSGRTYLERVALIRPEVHLARKDDGVL